MNTSFHSSIEPLEARIAPATVSMTLAGSTLKIESLSPTTGASVQLNQTGANSFDVVDDFAPPVSFSGVKAIQMKLSDVNDNVFFNLSGPYKGTVSIQSGTGADFVLFGGIGRVAGDVSVSSLANATLIIDSAARLTGAVKFSAVGGNVTLDGQMGALTASGISNFFGGSSSALQSAKISAAATGSTVSLQGFVAEGVSVTGTSASDQVVHTGRINGNLSLKLGDGSNTVYSFGSIGGSLSIQGGIGNDSITIQPGTAGVLSSGFGIGGRISLNLGDGSNNAQISGSGQVGGAITYKGGAGSDTLHLVSSLLVGGNVSASLGAGNNSLVLGGAYVFGGLKATGLDGNDTVNFSGGNVYGKTTLSLGDGNNSALFGGGLFSGGVNYKGGIGNDSVSFGGTNVGGLVSVAAGEGTNSLVIGGGELRGGVKFKGGAGNDTVSISGSEVAGTVAVDAGDGSNSLWTNVPLALARLTYKGGLGADSVTLLATSGLISPMTAISVSLGDGDDTLTVQNGSFRTLKADGGLGNDVLNRDAAILPADIQVTNFETVNVV